MGKKTGLQATLNLTPHSTMIGPVAAFVQEFANARKLGENLSNLISTAAKAALEVILASQTWTFESPPIGLSLLESNTHLDMVIRNHAKPLGTADIARFETLMAERAVTPDLFAQIKIDNQEKSGQSILLRIKLPEPTTCEDDDDEDEGETP